MTTKTRDENEVEAQAEAMEIGFEYTAPGINAATLADLAATTPKSEIKQRVAYGKQGAIHNPDGTPKMLSYVDARFVQERLDATVGPENWQSDYEDTPNGVRCSISILVKNIGWVKKTDVGVPSNIEPVKGAHSDAFKRAAVQWGIGRDLYSPTPDEDEDAEPLATVRQQAQGNGRTQRYEQQDQQQDDDEPEGPPPDCPDHGPMVFRKGYNKAKRKNWKAYFCSDRDCQTTGPIWL